MVTLKEMEAGDILAIVEIESMSFAAPWSEQSFLQELNNKHAHYLVLIDEEKIIGYGGFWKILDEGHFTNLAIHPSRRGEGLGKRLIQSMLEKARSLEIAKVTLEVRTSNTVALKAYETFGFYIEGVRSRYYTNPTEDAIIMWLSL